MALCSNAPRRKSRCAHRSPITPLESYTRALHLRLSLFLSCDACCAQANEAVVRAAVAQSAHALPFASAAWRADKAVVLSALAHTGWALRDAAAALRNDKEVVVAAVRQHGGALHYASPALQVPLEAKRMIFVFFIYVCFVTFVYLRYFL